MRDGGTREVGRRQDSEEGGVMGMRRGAERRQKTERGGGRRLGEEEAEDPPG